MREPKVLKCSRAACLPGDGDDADAVCPCGVLLCDLCRHEHVHHDECRWPGSAQRELSRDERIVR